MLDCGKDAITGLYPPVSVLPSLSRLDEGRHRRRLHPRGSRHPRPTSCLPATLRCRMLRLKPVIGEEELSESDKQLMAFGRLEQEFIGCGNTDCTME